MIEIDAIAKADHPTLTSARALHHILELAQLREWPMPFATRGWDTGRVELQFHTHEAVTVWAAVLGVDLSAAPNVRATGTLLDTQVTVCAFVPEAVA